jgi:type VI protein secretion system component VasK
MIYDLYLIYFSSSLPKSAGIPGPLTFFVWVHYVAKARDAAAAEATTASLTLGDYGDVATSIRPDLGNDDAKDSS